MSAADELVDVTDEAGNVIGVVPRREMREKRLPHRCVYLLVFNNRRELFIHQRTATKDVFPSYWDVAVGGVLAAGETFDDGVKREALEEIGIVLYPELLFPFRYRDNRTTVHAMVYRALHEGQFQLQPEEITRGEFVTSAELDERMARDRFCPDSMEVWKEYQTHLRRGFPHA